MRREPSDAERKLWNALRDRQVEGVKFRRQVPIGRYIAGFVAYFPRLVIEVDGSQHSDNAPDRARDRWFEDRGFRVLRYWNPDVLNNLEGVLSDIAAQLAAKSPSSRPRPRRGPPSPAKGEGANPPDPRP